MFHLCSACTHTCGLDCCVRKHNIQANTLPDCWVKAIQNTLVCFHSHSAWNCYFTGRLGREKSGWDNYTRGWAWVDGMCSGLILFIWSLLRHVTHASMVSLYWRKKWQKFTVTQITGNYCTLREIMDIWWRIADALPRPSVNSLFTRPLKCMVSVQQKSGNDRKQARI